MELCTYLFEIDFEYVTSGLDIRHVVLTCDMVATALTVFIAEWVPQWLVKDNFLHSARYMKLLYIYFENGVHRIDLVGILIYMKLYVFL